MEVLASSPILCVSGSISGLGAWGHSSLSISLVCYATNGIVRLNPLSPVEEKDQGREILWGQLRKGMKEGNYCCCFPSHTFGGDGLD